MSNYPNSLDDDASIVRVDDNLTEIGSQAINQLRSAVFAVETELGLGLAGSSGSLATRLGVSINANGTLKPSAIASAGALVGPISNIDVAPTAAIAESKLSLSYSTQSLYNSIASLTSDVNNVLDITSSLSLDFLKHLVGQNPLSANANARHVISHIDINAEPSDTRDPAFVWPNNTAPRSKTGQLRGSNLGTFIYNLNNEVVRHQNANGTVSTTADQYGHPAAAISLDSTGFIVLPKTLKDVQGFATAVDRASFSATSNHQQNHHTNGISRTCRGTIIPIDGYGPSIVPYTQVRTYLAHNASSTVVDSNTIGDDIVEFTPTQDTIYYFDSLFSKVQTGDVLTIDSGATEVQYLVDSVNYGFDSATPPNRTYLVRINGRNLFDGIAVARIDRPQYSENKYGVLALGQADNSFGKTPSLLVGHPRAAAAIGLGFNAAKFDATHFNLHLQIYPTGNPLEKAITLPGIDVTGNAGATPGLYTIDSIVQATNAAFRKEGFNYRFMAFSYNGEFGVMLSDAIGNASFSIVSGSTDGSGTLLAGIYGNNVVGDATDSIDPLGFGQAAANIASPNFRSTFITINQAQFPTKIFVSLKNKNYYVNGNERATLHVVSDGYADQYGDTYWLAQSIEKTTIPNQTVKVKYKIPLDLRGANLHPGKTLLVQPIQLPTDATYSDIDYGRFTISDVSYTLCNGTCSETIVEVYNAVHGTGTAVSTVNINIPVKLYYSDDSVGFTYLNIANSASSDKFKRLFETYVDSNGHTFTHERLRYNLSTGNAQLIKANIVKVAPKLRGYLNGSIRQINLRLTSYDANTGAYTGFLGKNSTLNVGPTATGRKGEVTRFYDETGVDYIDLTFDINDTVASVTNVDITYDLFASLQLDQEVFFLGTVLFDELLNKLTYLRDGRQFGNLSEHEFSNSAIDFVTAGDRFTHQNGVVRGLTYVSTSIGTSVTLTYRGGLALINGKYTEVNNFTATLPLIKELYQSTQYATVLWALCVNSKNEIQTIPLTDLDTAGSAINDPTRIFTAYNPTTTQSYAIESVTFTDLVTRRKDLTPISLVRVTYGTPHTCTVLDARKMIRDDSANAALVWTSSSSSGNFQTFEALNTWLRFNSTFNSTVRVRGTFSFTSAQTFDYPSTVKFVGDGATINLTGTTLFNLGSNVSFDGIKFNYIPSVDGNYVPTNLINSSSGALYCSVATNQNISITNCEFNCGTSTRHPFIVFNYISSSSSLQNVTISKNKFNYTGSSSIDEVRAVVAFTAPTVENSASPARLVNALIEDNVCNKNQMISVSADYSSGSSTVPTALVTIGCKIRNNICGAINFLTKMNIPSLLNTITAISDKFEMMVISGNTCRLIYTGTNSGNFLVGAGVRAPLALATGVFSGSAIIENNTCSWIQCGQRATSGTLVNSPTLIIKHNKITAFNPSYLSDYYNGFTPVNTAVIVDKVGGA